MGGWWAFHSDLPGHSFVGYKASPAQAENAAILSGTTKTGPFPNKQRATSMVGKKVTPPGKQNPKGNPNGALIVSHARTWLGVPYLFGGTTRRGVDCSGLVQNVAFESGIPSCPRTSEEQWAWVQKIPASQAGPGDLIFFVGAELDPPPGHVSIIVTPGLVISADTTGTVVRYDHYSLNGTGVSKVIGFGRMPGVSPSASANFNLGGPVVNAGGGVVTFPAGGIAHLVASGAVVLFMIFFFAILVATALLLRG